MIIQQSNQVQKYFNYFSIFDLILMKVVLYYFDEMQITIKSTQEETDARIKIRGTGGSI